LTCTLSCARRRGAQSEDAERLQWRAGPGPIAAPSPFRHQFATLTMARSASRRRRSPISSSRVSCRRSRPGRGRAGQPRRIGAGGGNARRAAACLTACAARGPAAALPAVPRVAAPRPGERGRTRRQLPHPPCQRSAAGIPVERRAAGRRCQREVSWRIRHHDASGCCGAPRFCGAWRQRRMARPLPPCGTERSGS
jgi:hypothetical protein